MPVPLVGIAIGAAARLAAKKAAQEAAKRAAKTAATRARSNSAAAAKAAAKKKPLANPKSAVKVKPAAKQKPNKPDAAKTQFKNDSSRNRTSDRVMKAAEKDEWNQASRNTDPSYSSKLGASAALRTPLKRKPNLKNKSK
jgi:hypothetical protein